MLIFILHRVNRYTARMPALPYSIEQSRNRTSRATIHNGAVLIRLARNLSAKEEERHIEVLLKRMTKAFLKEQTRVAIDPFYEVLAGAPMTVVHLVTGQSVQFDVELGTKNRIKAHGRGWNITRAPHTDKRVFERLLWKLLARSALASVRSLVFGINEETLQVDIKNVALKMMRSRWGSCGRKGQIALSTPLLLTSPNILRYVIIHELSHMPHPNHSRSFWKTVEIHMPEYRERIKELRKFKLSLCN